jgi:putative ABC transport system permease protein
MLLLEDLRYALRTLRKAPTFATTAVMALSLGIGANVAIFSLVDALVLRPLPLSHPESLVDVREDESFLGFPRDTPAPGNFVDWKQRNHVFTDMGALNGRIFAITGDGPPEQVEGNPITANLFPLLGVKPILGRNILPEEDRPGSSEVALISHRLWQQRYGASRTVVGRDIFLDGVKHRIIGVMPRGFTMMERSDIWIPIALSPERLAVRSSHYLIVLARMKQGMTLADAQRDMSAIASQLAVEHPDTNRHVGAVVIDLREELLGDLHLAVWVLAGGVGSVLLISCANLAGLMLARAAGRQREMAIRTALGAGRFRMVRQGLAESLMIGLAGGTLGVLLASWIVPWLGRIVPTVLTGWAEPRIDLRLLAFACLASVFSALLFGALPALKMACGLDTGGSLASVLQSGGRGTIGGHSRLRRVLVAGEVALAVIVSVGAALMVQTVWRLAHVDLGFRPEGVLTLRTSLPLSSRTPYVQFPARNAFYQGVLERVEAIPGVISAGYTTFLPLTNRGGTTGFVVEGAPPLGSGERDDANHRVVSADYFETIGVRLVDGRFFNRFDNPTAMPVAIVNQAMAKQYWTGANPLGKRFRFGGEGDTTWFTIVGVVGDVRQMALDVAGRAEMYFPSTQVPASVGYFTPRDLAVRVKGNPLQYAAAVRQAVWSVDRNQPISDVRPLGALVDQELSAQRIQLWLLGSFAGLGLLLAAIGLYGLLSHMVVDRTRDIGVRMALGARRSQVLVGVMRQGLELVVAGLVVGAIGALWQTRLMQKMLYGVKPTDPATFAAVAFTLLAVGALACYIPARRATRIDPMHALRHE